MGLHGGMLLQELAGDGMFEARWGSGHAARHQWHLVSRTEAECRKLRWQLFGRSRSNTRLANSCRA
jgi:hypothetical protein